MQRTLWLVWAVLIATSPLAAEDLTIPTLPASTPLAGNFVYEGRWYVMGGNEIACLTKLLSEKPWQKPDDVDKPSLPPMNERIILWGQDAGHLVATDVIECDVRVTFLRSQRKSEVFATTGSDQYKPLQEMVERIHSEKEHPVARPTASSDDVVVQRLKGTLPSQKEALRDFLWRYCVTQRFRKVETRDPSGLWSEYRRTLLAKARAQSLNHGSLEECLDALMKRLPEGIACIPVGAYLGERDGKETWIIVVSWETTSHRPVIYGHIWMFVIDAKTAEIVCEERCG